MWLFGGSSFANVEVALQQLVQGLQAAGFEAERQDDHSVTPGSPSREASASELLLLLTSTHAKLRRAHYTEQLDAWIVQRGVGEFAPADADPSAFSPARRTALLYPSLARALPELQRDVLRGSDLLQLHRVFPPHDRRFNLGLMRHLAQRLFLQAQVLHQLRNVYGEKVAFLFAFRNFYQRWLRTPAVLGLGLQLSRLLAPKWAALLQPLFGLGISLWGTALLEAWRLQQHELAVLWEVEELRESEVVRPEFVGERVRSRLTGERTTLYYPRWKRVLKRCVTIPMLGAQLLLLMAIIVGLYAAYVHIHASDLNRPLKTLLVAALMLVWGILVEVLNWRVFKRVADWINHWENHRTSSEFERQLALKLFAFLFVDGFLWYFVLAFLHIPFAEHFGRLLALPTSASLTDHSVWMGALSTSVCTLLTVCVPLATLWSTLPTLLSHMRVDASHATAALRALRRGRVDSALSALEGGERRPLAAATLSAGERAEDSEGSDDDDGAPCNQTTMFARSLVSNIVARLPGSPLRDSRRLRQINEWTRPWARRRSEWYGRLRGALRRMIEADSLLEESRRPVYEPLLDHAKIALEFGYVLMFTVVWPLAPLACLGISALEQRAAALRLAVGCRRPVSEPCRGLGAGNAWYAVLQFLAWASCVVNCLMIAIATAQVRAAALGGRVDTPAALHLPHLPSPHPPLQLDVYFETPLSTYKKLLLGVLAEHLLIAAKLLMQAFAPDARVPPGRRPPRRAGDDAPPTASRLPTSSPHLHHLSQELKRKYLNAHAPAEEFSPNDDDASREPRLAALYPSSGPRGCATALSVRGELLGRAVTHGEITLSALLPRASRPVDIPATFVSDTKLECVLPPSEHPGVAHLSLARAKATLTPLSPSATAASAAAAAAAPALPAAPARFTCAARSPRRGCARRRARLRRHRRPRLGSGSRPPASSPAAADAAPAARPRRLHLGDRAALHDARLRRRRRAGPRLAQRPAVCQGPRAHVHVRGAGVRDRVSEGVKLVQDRHRKRILYTTHSSSRQTRRAIHDPPERQVDPPAARQRLLDAVLAAAVRVAAAEALRSGGVRIEADVRAVVQLRLVRRRREKGRLVVEILAERIAKLHHGEELALVGVFFAKEKGEREAVHQLFAAPSSPCRSAGRYSSSDVVHQPIAAL